MEKDVEKRIEERIEKLFSAKGKYFFYTDRSKEKLKSICFRFNLMPEVDVFLGANNEGDQREFITIAREAYRRIAKSQPSFSLCYSIPVYENDVFCIGSDGNPTIKTSGNKRGHLLGAYAVLYFKNEITESAPAIQRPLVQYAALNDFSNNNLTYWQAVGGKQAFMISKVAEVMAIRAAYPDIFSDTYIYMYSW